MAGAARAPPPSPIPNPVGRSFAPSQRRRSRLPARKIGPGFRRSGFSKGALILFGASLRGNTGRNRRVKATTKIKIKMTPLKISFWRCLRGMRSLKVTIPRTGEFLCLVCGGSGQKVGRKYKNCGALVQHTITISNTKKRAAHRAYGHVISKVLEWDINQLHLVSKNLCLQQGNEMSRSM